MRNLRLALLGLAAIAAILLGAGFLQRALQGDRSSSSPQEDAVTPQPARNAALTEPRRQVEAAIATSAEYTRFFDRLRLVFPGDYDLILDGLAQAAPGSDKTASADALMADAVGALRKSRGSLAAQASDEALGRIFTFQLDEMRSLAARDAHLCVAFLYGANSSGFTAFAAEHRGLIADAALSGLDAMNSGRIDKIQRANPSDGDFQALDKALTEKGMTRPEIEALLDGKAADPPIADERMCRAGQTYLETLASLAPAARARLYGLAVDLMAKS